MKKYLPYLLMSLALISCSGYQYITQKQGTKTFIESQPLKKDKAYDAVLEWAAKNIISQDNSNQVKDKGKGIIIYQAVRKDPLVIDFHYILSISVKDQKIKIEFITKNIVDSDQPPIVNNLDQIFNYYSKIKNSLIDYLKNYNKQENF